MLRAQGPSSLSAQGTRKPPFPVSVLGRVGCARSEKAYAREPGTHPPALTGAQRQAGQAQSMWEQSPRAICSLCVKVSDIPAGETAVATASLQQFLRISQDHLRCLSAVSLRPAPPQHILSLSGGLPLANRQFYSCSLCGGPTRKTSWIC